MSADRGPIVVPAPTGTDRGPTSPGGSPPSTTVGRPAPPIVCGADLVVLAENAQVRLFRLAGGFLLVGSVLAAFFGSGSADDPAVVTWLAVVFGGAVALGVALRPLPAYLALRRGRAARVLIATGASAAVLAGGVDGPSWWVALGVVLLLATVSSMRFAVGAAFVIATAYVVGSLLAGGTLERDGIDAGVVAGASGLPLYALVMRVVTEGFARVLLMLHRSTTAEVRGLPDAPPAPLRADGAPWTPAATTASSASGEGPAHGDVMSATTVSGDGAAGGPVVPAAGGDRGGHVVPFRPPGRRGAGGSSRLTVRQLEVALLARDGLLQAEIAEALGISVTQVERHLRQGRERVGAATVGQLLGVLVADGIIGPPEQADVAAAVA